MRAFACLAFLAFAVPAHAADFAIESFSGPTPIIGISGQIEIGDDLKFTRFAALLNTAIVRLNSAGGRLAPALTIGDIIGRKGFSTYVGPQAVCSSACGLIWLAGKPRAKDATALVGFHAAYVADGQGVNRENGLSNALVGAYLNRLDLSTDAIMFATAAAPDRMAWITPQAGRQYGIAFEVTEQDIATLRTAAPSRLAPAPMPADRQASTQPSAPPLPIVPQPGPGEASDAPVQDPPGRRIEIEPRPGHDPVHAPVQVKGLAQGVAEALSGLVDAKPRGPGGGLTAH